MDEQSRLFSSLCIQVWALPDVFMPGISNNTFSMYLSILGRMGVQLFCSKLGRTNGLLAVHFRTCLASRFCTCVEWPGTCVHAQFVGYFSRWGMYPTLVATCVCLLRWIALHCKDCLTATLHDINMGHPICQANVVPQYRPHLCLRIWSR